MHACTKGHVCVRTRVFDCRCVFAHVCVWQGRPRSPGRGEMGHTCTITYARTHHSNKHKCAQTSTQDSAHGQPHTHTQTHRTQTRENMCARTHAQIHAQACTPQKPARAHTRKRVHKHTHKRTHIHTRKRAHTQTHTHAYTHRERENHAHGRIKQVRAQNARTCTCAPPPPAHLTRSPTSTGSSTCDRGGLLTRSLLTHVRSKGDRRGILSHRHTGTHAHVRACAHTRIQVCT
jgi:hypothetical protein